MSGPRCHDCAQAAEPVVVETADGRRWCEGCHERARLRAGVEVAEAARRWLAACWALTGSRNLAAEMHWRREIAGHQDAVRAAIDAYDSLRPEVKP